MKVTLVAHTKIVDWPDSIVNTSFWDYDMDTYSDDADRLAHFAGRSCYQAWDMPREETANDMGYMANIIKQGHFSVLEHGSATFYIEDISRNLTHELIRHRHLSYSELSQRYVKMEDSTIIIPPAVDSIKSNDQWLDTVGLYGKIMAAATEDYKKVLLSLDVDGVKGKKAREAARGLLPGGTATKIVVTGNHRAWRDMLMKRYSVHADAEILELAKLLLKELRQIAPATYQDFPEEPFQ